MLLLIKGAGDLASGIAVRLHRAGFSIVMTDLSAPTSIRRTVCFSEAIRNGTQTVEGVEAVCCTSVSQALGVLSQKRIAVLPDPDCLCLSELKPDVVVDAILAKRNLGTKRTDAPIVIGVGPGFQKEIRATICGIPLEDVIREVKAGIEEEGMVPRVVKVLKTSDVCFMGLEAAKISGSGIGIGLQSKGTAVIHQKDLYPLSNLELFPQAPLMNLETYRKIGQNAAKYAKGEQVTPISSVNDPMCRAKYQVKAAIMHIAETEQVDPNYPIIAWPMQ